MQRLALMLGATLVACTAGGMPVAKPTDSAVDAEVDHTDSSAPTGSGEETGTGGGADGAGGSGGASGDDGDPGGTTDPIESDMLYDPSAPYPEPTAMRVKGIQPDFWLDPVEISGNNAGSVAMNLVWAAWQPSSASPPCSEGQVAYDGACFTPQSAVDQAITTWTDLGLDITAVVYGVPEWARQSRDCTPAAPGFEIFCVPDDATEYARFVGMLARRYNGANGVGRVSDFVIHNEVNSNTWFDVGCGQGVDCDAAEWLSVYTDNYVAAFDAVRREQTEAKIYVSLDHHFGSPDYDLPTAASPLLAGQTVLSAVASAAGSRDWRVAYHPYPPNLLAPDFSPDDWPKVTYGNLGALPGWLASEWPGSAAATDIHLTESGVNSLTGSSQAAQADGVCDSFRNVLGTPGIRRYIYHRMQDHPDETAAGLGVGLWGSDGVAKQAWAVWALANRDDLSPPQLSCGFEELPHTLLIRSHHSTRGHWASSRVAPAGFTEEHRWRLWREEQADTTLLYACRVGQHNLLTAAADCEGLPPLGPVGWIHNGPDTGRVALYLCRVASNGDHFVSESASCEGQEVEQLLGYAIE